jgi:predicted transposase YdaD
LFSKGYDKIKVREFFEFINGIIKIEDELKQKLFYEEIKKLEGGKYMAVISDFSEYVTRVNKEKWIEEGMEQNKSEVAKKMLEDGLPVEAILKYTGLMMENIKELMMEKVEE